MSTRASRSRASFAPAASAISAQVAAIATAKASTKKKRTPAASPAKRGRARVASPAGPAARVPSKSPAGKKRTARSAKKSPAASSKKKKPTAASSKKKRASKSPAKRARSPANERPDVQSPAKKAKVVRKSVSKSRRQQASRSPVARRSKSPAAGRRGRQQSRSRSRSAAVRRESASRSRSRSRTGRGTSRSRSRSASRPVAKKVAAGARKSVAAAAEAVQAATQAAVHAIQAAQAHAHQSAAAAASSKPPAPARKSVVPEENEEDIASDSEQEEDGSESPEVREADRTPPKAPRFSAVPTDGGLGFMPRVSSYPSTPKAAGVSTILTALNNVAVPQAIFMSPFPQDRRQAARRSFGGSQPNQPADDDEDDEEEEDEQRDSVEGFSNPFSAAQQQQQPAAAAQAKKLRPTLAQSQAEARKANGASSLGGASSRAAKPQGDTPTVSRARSRMNQDDADERPVARKIGEAPEADDDDDENGNGVRRATTSSFSSTRRTLNGVDVEETFHRTTITSSSSSSKRTSSSSGKAQRGGLVSTHDSTVPWTAAGLLLLGVAQFLALNVIDPSSDRLGLQALVRQGQDQANGLIHEYAAPVVGRFFALSTTPLQLTWLTTPSDWAWLLVPALYLFAALIVKHGYALTAKDLHTISSTAVAESSARANARHAHHVFVSALAFVTAISFWVLYTAAEVATPASVKAPGAPGAPVVPVAVKDVAQPIISSVWYAAFLILTTFSWAITEVLVFARDFSTQHLVLWTPILVVSELAFWKVVPPAIFACLPPFCSTLHALLLSYYPPAFTAALATSAFTASLVVVQVAEFLKGLSGVCFSVIGKLLLFGVPAAYLYGEKYIFELLGNVAGSFWLESMLALAAVGALSGWEIIQHVRQLQVERME